MNTVLLIIQLIALLLPFVLLVWFWKTRRHHRRIMRLLDDADRAIETFKTCKTPEELTAKLERVNEILEHASQLQKR
jgi:hypothetical protein